MAVEVFLETGCGGSSEASLKDNLTVDTVRFIFICHQTRLGNSFDLPSHHHTDQASCHDKHGQRDCDENTDFDVNIRIVVGGCLEQLDVDNKILYCCLRRVFPCFLDFADVQELVDIFQLVNNCASRHLVRNRWHNIFK